MSLLAFIVLAVALLAVLPIYPYNRAGPTGPGWGPYPAGGIGTLILVLVLLYVFGVFR